MTSSEVRQSFLDFFKSKQHTIVPSSSLMPDSPNLLFTNAGMNQFVPIFLGQRAPDVDKWAGAIPALPTRAADTQKCIRAGGKHNDLEDVGLDTYHHTFFEMLGNWSYGDYFKKEAIEWAWELITEVWKFPKHRLYATVYKPGAGDPAAFDQEAYDLWSAHFTKAGLDPKVHIQFGGKKDNFWMMGDTGPCGPCSEIHMDLTPQGDTQGKLVNAGTAQCIEIWNLVFIQFNANPDGTFSPLPARHVDTGMGFERVTGIMQCTKNFKDFSRTVSNYESDVFRPIFDMLEKLSGKHYGSTLPAAGATSTSDQEKIDIAFRVIADHIRTLSFAIADGITPGNNGRNYVLRRILRRAVRYGRTLGFHEPFFYKLVDVLVATMGSVFPEIKSKQQHIQETIRREEEAFNKTLDTGLEVFTLMVNLVEKVGEVALYASPRINRIEVAKEEGNKAEQSPDDYLQHVRTDAAEIHEKFRTFNYELWDALPADFRSLSYKGDSLHGAIEALTTATRIPEDVYDNLIQSVDDNIFALKSVVERLITAKNVFFGESAFMLYDTYGFPLDLTELLARERGLRVDVEGFERMMEEQKARARAAQKKSVITLSEIESTTPTHFVGYDKTQSNAKVLEVVRIKDKTAVILDTTPFYAESGGQVGDQGELTVVAQVSKPAVSQASQPATCAHFWRVTDTIKSGHTILHMLAEEPEGLAPGMEVQASVDLDRRRDTMRHHTVTHLLHWALHQIVNPEATQKGSYVGPDKLTFDFSSAALTPAQVKEVEQLVNQRILENASVSWRELPYAEIRTHKDVMQFFGEKYGDKVRVLQVGGNRGELNGFSMELCGGTHVSATGEIGSFRILSEAAVASGIRRIEAVAGLRAYEKNRQDVELLSAAASKVSSPINELEKKLDALLAQQKELEKQLKAAHQKEAAELGRSLQAKAQTINNTRAIIENVGAASGDDLQAIADSLKGQFKGVVVLGGTASGAVSLIATVSADLTKQVQAGKLIQAIAPIVGGKGGGRPDNARGGGKDTAKLDEALAKAKTLLP